MPYLPPENVLDTTIPIPLGKDFWLQVRLIAGKWNRGFFPLLTYRPISKQPTMQPDAPDALPNNPVGELGTTGYDPLYGEAVDPQMIVDGKWKQPHLSGTLKAANPEVYENDVQFRVRVQIDVTDSDLHFWGFDTNRGLIASVPASILDDVGVTAKPGDLLLWFGDWYEVVQVGPNNRWLNSATALYVGMNLQRKRNGS